MHPSSPAENAGLRPFTDYIIGADSILHESEDLFTLIETHEDRSLKLYVYNTETDSCREVNIIPNSRWGGADKPGAGMLGCEIGFGYLHRIPLKNGAPTSKPAEVIKSYFTETQQPLATTLEPVQPTPTAPLVDTTPFFTPNLMSVTKPEHNIILPSEPQEVQVPPPHVELFNPLAQAPVIQAPQFVAPPTFMAPPVLPSVSHKLR